MILGNFVRAGSKQPESLATIIRVVLMIVGGVSAFVVGAAFSKWVLIPCLIRVWT